VPTIDVRMQAALARLTDNEIEQARAQYIAMGDENGDGKLDFAEFRAWMAPNIAKNGIPAEWREDIEQNYRASTD
jgi:hypothetical protein